MLIPKKPLISRFAKRGFSVQSSFCVVLVQQKSWREMLRELMSVGITVLLTVLALLLLLSSLPYGTCLLRIVIVIKIKFASLSNFPISRKHLLLF